jgi:hypothetical protein
MFVASGLTQTDIFNTLTARSSYRRGRGGGERCTSDLLGFSCRGGERVGKRGEEVVGAEYKRE